MFRRWQRGCAILTAVCLLGLFGACALLGIGVRTRAIMLPPVLLHNEQVWIGDRCRAYLNTTELAERGCLPVYSIDVVVHERARPQYLLLQIPLE